MKKIVECVPNFSEGRDTWKIQRIVDGIEMVEGIKLLNVAPDKDHNRTVITFVGSPEQVKQAAFEAITRAQELIDMSLHRGEHPRMGACDVCPFIPISPNVTMEECVALAYSLGFEVGLGLGIPVYLYEEAATTPDRRNLAVVRAGEYEGLEEKMKNPLWQPDYGPSVFNRKSGATAIGARMFLIAYNVNLASPDKKIADRISQIIRGSGWQGTLNDGKKIRVPGVFKSVKAKGVLLRDQGISQVSMNLTNHKVVSMHVVYEIIKKLAGFLGTEALGSEIVGVVLKEAILNSGRFYLPNEQSEQQLIENAIKNLGLDQLEKFVPKKKVIEYMIEEEK